MNELLPRDRDELIGWAKAKPTMLPNRLKRHLRLREAMSVNGIAVLTSAGEVAGWLKAHGVNPA